MRLKIIAGNVAVFLLVGLGAFFYLQGQVEDGFGARFDAELRQASPLFSRSWRLSAVEFVEQVENRAATPQVRSAIRAIDQNSRRRAAHDRANSVAAWFQDPTRNRTGRPDIVLMTDETGRVIARDQDLNRMGGQSLMQKIPTLRGVLEGTAAHDAWFRESENKLLQVAMAPIRNDSGGVVGALVVGYDISDGIAQNEAEVLGMDVAFVRDGRIYSSSLSPNEASAATGALGEGRVEFDVDGTHYVGVSADLPSTPSVEASYLVLGNRSEFLEPAASLNVLLILVLVGVALMIAYGFLIGTAFLRPVEEIEEGILNVINGRTETRLDIEGGEFGGLAYRINQLLNMLLGTEEADADGNTVGGTAWEDNTTASSAAASAPASSGEEDAAATELAAEPEDAYHTRIYKEYVAAKQAIGEDVSNIPEDRFIGRLQKNAAKLVTKHGCRMVRFQVQTKGTQVILRPVIIR